MLVFLVFFFFLVFSPNSQTPDEAKLFQTRFNFLPAPSQIGSHPFIHPLCGAVV